ncbi:MAG: GIY-YIG nuclease family protein [Nitrospira sp.]|nr:GIY-YIG nuclease family protein [Nitrospira sp.]
MANGGSASGYSHHKPSLVLFDHDGEASPFATQMTDPPSYQSQENMYHLYILLNKAGTRTYTGVSDDVDRRLKEHNDGNVPSSRPYRPYRVIYTQTFTTLREARQKERYYKSTTGRRRIKEILSSLSSRSC